MWPEKHQICFVRAFGGFGGWGWTLTLLYPAQMQDQQVGDASVLVERQAEGRLGLAARHSVAVHAVDMAVDMAVDPIGVSVDAVTMAVDSVHSIRNVVLCIDSLQYVMPGHLKKNSEQI